MENNPTIRTSIHPRLKQKIFERDNFTCVNCGALGDFNCLETDHIISIIDGGTNDESNLQTLCYKCNLDKYYHKDVRNNFLLDISPLERLKLIKDKLESYKCLTIPEFKVIFTQDELFKRLRVNYMDVIDLFVEISGKKKHYSQFDNRYAKQRDTLIHLYKKKTKLGVRELSKLFSKHKLEMSFQQIAKICKQFEQKKDENVVKSD